MVQRIVLALGFAILLAGAAPSRPRQVGWAVGGIVFDRIMSFDEYGHARPPQPPTAEERAAIRRCEQLYGDLGAQGPYDENSFLGGCLAQAGVHFLPMMRTGPGDALDDPS